jgi:hypothetical protein
MVSQPYHDTKGGPHLPLHDESASELGRRTLGGKHGRRGRLGPDAQTENEARDKHVPPRVGEGLPETSRGRDDAGHEDGPPAAKHLVHGIRQPAADKGTAEIRRRVDEADQPRVSRALCVNAKLDLVEGLGAVDDGLVHTLDGRAKGADLWHIKSDRQVAREQT